MGQLTFITFNVKFVHLLCHHHSFYLYRYKINEQQKIHVVESNASECAVSLYIEFNCTFVVICSSAIHVLPEHVNCPVNHDVSWNGIYPVVHISKACQSCAMHTIVLSACFSIFLNCSRARCELTVWIVYTKPLNERVCFLCVFVYCTIYILCILLFVGDVVATYCLFICLFSSCLFFFSLELFSSPYIYI